MVNITSRQALEYGPSQLPEIETICKYMINTRRFSKETQSILQWIWVPDCVSRETIILFNPDAESKIPEWFIKKIQKEFDDDWRTWG